MKKKNFKAFVVALLLFISAYIFIPSCVFAEEIDQTINENQYTINYEFDGGTPHPDTVYTFEVSSYGVLLEYPTKEGYTFQGWYLDEELTQKVEYIDTTVGKDYTVYAKWEENSYKLILLDNNPSGGYVIEHFYKYTDKVTLTNTFTRSNYVFVGWNTKKDGTGKSYKDKEIVSGLTSVANGSVNLYAQWRLDTYTISYNYNGGNTISNPTTYNVTSIIAFNSPTRFGYTFGGWYSDSKFKKKVTKISKGTTGNRVLYAKWVPNTYTIKFDKNGATSGKMSNLTKRKYNTAYKLTNNGYKRKGYTFVGWNTKKDGTGTNYANKASIKNLTSVNKGTVVLYAQWKPITYTISYNLNGGTNANGNPSTYNINSAIVLSNPTRYGYTFQGWYSDSKFKKKVITIPRGSTGNKTLYAKWKQSSSSNSAVNLALSYLRSSSFSRRGLIDQLKYHGYTESQATYAVDHCGANWYVQAVKEAKSYLKSMPFSKEGLIDQLIYEKYTEAEAEYGVANCGANWYEQAIKEAQGYLKYMPYSKEGLIEQLIYEKYTEVEAEYGVENCGANWYEEAKRSAKKYMDLFNFSYDRLVEQLEYEGFTEDEAEYGARNYND